MKKNSLKMSSLVLVSMISTSLVNAQNMTVTRPPSKEEQGNSAGNQQAGAVVGEKSNELALQESSYKPDSVNNQAQTTSKNENMGANLLYVVAGVLGAKGAAAYTKATGCSWASGCAPYFFGVAGALFVASTMAKNEGDYHLDASREAAKNANETTGRGNENGSNGSPTNGSGLAGANGNAVGGYGLKLPPGVSVNKKNKTITLGDGKTYKFSDFESKQAMEKAGLPGGAFGAAQSLASQAQAEAMKEMEKKTGKLNASLEADGGGGGAGGLGAGGAGTDSASGYGNGQGRNHDASLREPTSVAGMSKTFNGEQIGVSADDIFKMMNRRYEVKKTQDTFLTEAALNNK